MVLMAFSGMASAASPVQPTPAAAPIGISLSEAGSLALWFVADDMATNPTSGWSKATRLSKITTLYNENDIPSGYSFELKTGNNDAGYVIVSATEDSDAIKEYAYQGQPLFYQNTAGHFDKVYFTGTLNYTVLKDEKLFDTNGKPVERQGLKSHFGKSSNVADLDTSLLAKVRSKGVVPVDTWYTGYAGTTSGAYGYGGITDPYAFVNDAYGSGWTLSTSKTISGVTAHLLTEWSDDSNCALGAITTVFQYWRGKGYSNIPSSVSTLYADVKAKAVELGAWSESTGTDPFLADNVVTAVWAKYNYPHGTGSNIDFWAYSSFTSQVDNNRPALINIHDGYYADHTVTLFGYKTYNKTLNTDKGFLQVYDGWVTASRYISYADFAYSTLSNITTVVP